MCSFKILGRIREDPGHLPSCPNTIHSRVLQRELLWEFYTLSFICGKELKKVGDLILASVAADSGEEEGKQYDAHRWDL